MKKITLFVVLVFISTCSFAQVPDLAKKAAAFGAPSSAAAANVLDESDDIKKLILKYAEAEPSKKPAVRKEIEALETKNENENIKKTDMRIKRQEDRVKELKKNNEARKKNVKQTVSGRVEYLVSDESVAKIKEESVSKKITDKIKRSK